MADTFAITQAFNTAGAKQQPAAKVPFTPEETARRAAINAMLLQQAQDSFDTKTMPASTNTYAQQLQTLENNVNGHLVNSMHYVNVLDPTTFHAGLALGLTPVDAVSRMIIYGPPPKLAGNAEAEKKVSELVDQNMVYGLLGSGRSLEPMSPEMTELYTYRLMQARYKVDVVAEEMAKPYSSRGITTHTQAGSAHPSGDPDLIGTCTIVPGTELNPRDGASGLPYEDNLRYIGLHEGWHCRDQSIFIGDAGYSKIKDIKSINKLPDDPDARRAFARSNQHESLADVGAVGDMIRQGKSLATLDSVLQGRRDNAWDGIHYSAPSLAALREKITEMGIEKFRKLDDKQAEALYKKVVADNALTEGAIAHIQQSQSWNPVKFLPTYVTRYTDADVGKALSYQRRLGYDKFIGEQKQMFGFLGELGSGVKRQLESYDAHKLLQDKAFALDKKITPATMIHAYAEMKDELHEKIQRDPANQNLYVAQMMKLQETFIRDVRETDYVGANLSRGVRIELVEPGLMPVRTAQAAPPQGSGKNAR